MEVRRARAVTGTFAGDRERLCSSHPGTMCCPGWCEGPGLSCSLGIPRSSRSPAKHSAGSPAMLEKPILHPPEVRAGSHPGRESSLPSLHSVLQFFLLGTTRCLIISTAQLLQKNDLCWAPTRPESTIIEDFPLKPVTNEACPPPRISQYLSSGFVAGSTFSFPHSTILLIQT